MGWRPPQWNSPAMVVLTVPASSSIQSNGMATDGINFLVNVTAQTSYVFDAVLELEHEQELEKTRHPVQTGADISSHAYLQPSKLVLSIGMSDAMDQYASATSSLNGSIQPWTGNASKSVSAYQQLLALQSSRALLTVQTRLRTYTRMLITRVSPKEDFRTITGLRARVEFEEVLLGSAVDAPLSTRPNDTASTGLGTVSTTVPSETVNNQFGVPPSNTQGFDQPTTNLYSYLVAHPDGVNVPGAGSYSSTPVNNMQNVAAP